MEGKVILGYWQTRGLAQRIRMIMEYIQLPYEEERHDGSKRQIWFKEIMPQLIKKNPAVTLPYLKDGNKLISESDAVMIYVIHKSGKTQLLGCNCDEQVKIATTYGVLKDVYDQYISLTYGTYQKSFEEAKVQYFEKFKPYLNKLDCLLGQKQYFADKITWIDFVVAELMQAFRLLDNNLIKSYTKLDGHIDRIWNLPSIKSYHQSNRYKERPINSPTVAKWY